MGRQIVQDYDVARPKSRSQLSLDVSFKNAPVHRRVNDEGGGQGVASQAGDEGLRLPVSERDFRKQPLPPQAAASQARLLIPEEAAPQFLDDAAPRNGMMPPPDSEMIAPPITE